MVRLGRGQDDERRLNGPEGTRRFLLSVTRKVHSTMTPGSEAAADPKSTLPIAQWKNASRGIAVVTAYDALFARLADDAGADAVLVGDSLGPSILAIPEAEVTLRDMVHHGSAVRRALRRSALLLDVPPRVAAQSPKRAVSALVRAAELTGAAAVKIEGAERHDLAVIEAALDFGLNVVGHLSRRHGSDEALRTGAHRLAGLGVPAIVLVGIPHDVARDISESEAAATISVHSGPHCDGALVNALEIAGFAWSPHERDGDKEVARGESVTASALARFCVEAKRTSQERDTIG